MTTPPTAWGRSRWSRSGSILVSPVVVPAPDGHMLVTRRPHSPAPRGPSAIVTVFPGERRSIPGLYTVQESRELPKINALMTVKSIILPKSWLGRYNVCVHRYRLLISFAGFFCYMVAIPVPLVSPRLGIGLAVLSCVPMLFIQMLTFLGLRYDMVRLVTKSYEFWYLTVVNTVCCVLLSIYLQGGRALICIPTIGGFQCVLLIDANFRAIKHMTRISIMAATAAIALTVCTATDLLRATHDFTIVTHRNMVVKASDVIAHGFVTSAVLLLRNAYYKRRYTQFSERHDTSRTGKAGITVVRCVGYQCRLTWRAVSTSFPRVSDTCAPRRSTLNRRGSAVLRLRSVGTLHVINARDAIFPIWSVDKAVLPLRLRSSLRVSGVVGFLVTGMAFIHSIIPHNPTNALVDPQRWHLVLATIGVVSTTCFITIFVATLYERSILIRICHSFDCLFLSTQVILAHVCFAFMCQWDARCLTIISSCLWLHWVITLDALSPLRREQLGIRVRTWAKVITAAGLALVSFVFVDLVAWNTQQFVNHVIARFSVRGRVIEWRVMPILLNRSLAIFIWLVRLLFRQLTYKEDDLVMLSGAVEYEDTILHRRRVRKETQERLNRMTPKLRAVNALSAMRRRSPLMHITEFSHKDT